MTSYRDSMDTQRRSFEILKPWFEGEFCDEGRYVLTDKGRSSREIQEFYGDMATQRRGELVWVELKAEERFTGNLFIEDWSNWSRGNPGWVHKLKNADLIFFHFLDVNRMYGFDFPQLREWLFASHPHSKGNRISQYRLLPQSKCRQLNDTWGRIVPIVDVQAATGVRSHVVNLNASDQESESACEREPEFLSLFG